MASQPYRCLDGRYRSGVKAWWADCLYANGQVSAIKGLVDDPGGIQEPRPRGAKATDTAVIESDWRASNAAASGLKAATTEGPRYIEVDESTVPLWTRRRAEQATADCAAERHLLRVPTITWVKAVGTVPPATKSWPTPTLGENLRGFYLKSSPGDEYRIFIVADEQADEWQAAEVAAHETYHLDEIRNWNLDGESGEQRALAYGKAYRRFREWARPMDRWGE